MGMTLRDSYNQAHTGIIRKDGHTRDSLTITPGLDDLIEGAAGPASPGKTTAPADSCRTLATCLDCHSFARK